MVKTDRVFVLLQTIFVVLGLIGAVEYFKYSTRINYDWFHCTPEVSPISHSIKQVVSTGGTSCDKRGQLKSITKRLTREFDPNVESIVSCIKEVDGAIIGYGSKVEDEDELRKLCGNVIHW